MDFMSQVNKGGVLSSMYDSAGRCTGGAAASQMLEGGFVG